jgi:hypothetical protein
LCFLFTKGKHGQFLLFLNLQNPSVGSQKKASEEALV